MQTKQAELRMKQSVFVCQRHRTVSVKPTRRYSTGIFILDADTHKQSEETAGLKAIFLLDSVLCSFII